MWNVCNSVRGSNWSLESSKPPIASKPNNMWVCMYCTHLFFIVNSQSCGCDVKYTKIGCYHDPGSYVNRGHMRPLRILLLNWRDKINWTEGWNDHLKNIACR